MTTLRLLLGFVLIAFSGCAAYELQPLSTNHPANAHALAAPERALSKTLAYSRADMLALSAGAGQQGRDVSDPGTDSNGQKTIVGEGKVIATVPSANQLVLEHGEIQGFMESMTMGYRVEPPSLLEGLKTGDKVRFTIDVQNKTIVKLEKLK
jgi:Cu/Ag efflux protein CusF